MEYVKGGDLPVPQFEGADFDLWYPITDGDHSCIKEVDQPLSLEDLISCLEEGDSLVADDEEADQLETLFPSFFVRSPAFWSGQSKLVYWPES